MKLLPLVLAASAACSEPFADVFVFGTSYHNQPGYNQLNTGLGLGLGFRDDYGSEWYVAGASYKDSYREQAIVGVVGVRAYAGDVDGWHATLAGNLGWLHGSGMNSAIALPVIGAGWRSLNAEMAPMPQLGVAAFWLRFRVPL